MNMECPICNKKFKCIEKHIKIHKLNIKEFYDKFLKNENDDLCNICKQNKTRFINLNKGYKKVCSKCLKSKEMIMKNNNLSEDEFKLLRSSSLNTLIKKYGKEEGIKKYNETNIKKRNSSQTKEHYIKWYGDDSINKWNNYISKTKQTKENFIKRYGKEEGIKKYNLFVDKSKQTKENFIKRYGKEEGLKKYKKSCEKRTSSDHNKFKFEYWKNKFTNLIDAKNAYNKFQIRNLNYFLTKYGDNEETRKWYKDYCLRKTKGWHGNTFSKISYNLFKKLENNYLFSDKIYYGKNEKKLIINKKVIYPDFLYKDLIIEFFGDFWHANPIIYKKNDINLLLNKSANEIWKEDNNRIYILKKNGYKVFIIWEKDYRNNENEMINKIIKFINEND